MWFLKNLFRKQSLPDVPRDTPETTALCPRIRLIGAYACRPSRKEMGTAALYYGYDHMVTKSGLMRADELSGADLSDLALVELEVTGPLDLNGVTCSTRGTQQAPYLELYLSVNGEDLLYQPTKHRCLRKISSMKKRFEEVEHSTDARRICFFLHFLQPGGTIVCGAESVVIHEITELPERLRDFIHYVPVG